MQWYLYKTMPDDYNRLVLSHADRPRVVQLHFTGTRVSDWVAPRPQQLASPLGDADFPALMDYGKIVVVSPVACNALLPLLGSAVQPLPIILPGGTYSILHILRIADCLDMERSRVNRNSVSGNVTWVYHHVLDEHLIPTDTHIVKSTLNTGAETFVSERFRDVVERHRLKGLHFGPMR